MADDEELILAVQRLRLANPSLTSNELHAELVAEWASVQLSDVRRARSKAAKRYGSPPREPVSSQRFAMDEHIADTGYIVDALRSKVLECVRRGHSSAQEVSKAICDFIAKSTDWREVKRCMALMEQMLSHHSGFAAMTEQLSAYHIARLVNQRCEHSLVPMAWALLTYIVSHGAKGSSSFTSSIWLRDSCNQALKDGLLSDVIASDIASFFGGKTPVSIITATYSLAELEATFNSGNFSQVMICPHQPPPIVPTMDVATESFFHSKLDIQTGNLLSVLMACGPGITDRSACEELDSRDWAELFELAGSGGHDAIAAWKEARALQMRAEADRSPHLTDAALRVSAHCARARNYSLQLWAESGATNQAEFSRRAKCAMEAGQAVMQLVNAFEVHRGNMYSWLPGRDYLRALLRYAIVLEVEEKWEQAETMFNKLLGCDRLDHFGARMPLLRLTIRNHGLGSKPLKHLLKTAYGFDRDRISDTRFASFTYTRALDAFIRELASADELLQQAIVRNSFVPALLLGWETLNDGMISLMEVGASSEATIYVKQFASYWTDVALNWLERTYCTFCHACSPIDLVPDHAARAATRLELRGNSHTIRRQWQQATRAFSEAIQQSAQGSALHVRCLHARALVHIKRDPPDHVSCINDLTELLRINPQHRAGRFLRADMRGEIGEIQGAKDDYTYVLQHLDANAIQAQQELKALYRKEGSPVPEWLQPQPFGPTQTEMDQHKESIAPLLQKCRNAMPDRRGLDRVSADNCCANCQRKETKLRACAGCNAVRYCSESCQRQHWKTAHKMSCAHMALIGKNVTLHSLSATSMNGKQGRVLEFVQATGRMSVQLQNAQAPIAVKPANVALTADA